MTEDKLSQFAEGSLQKKIAAVIIQSPSASDNEIAALVLKDDGGHPSRSYVARVRGKLGITPTEAEAHAPEITVTREELAPEALPTEEREGLELPPEERPPIELPSEAGAPQAPSDDEILKPIFDRGFNRLLNDVIIKRLIKIEEKITNEEEISDIETLALIDLKRLTGAQLTGDNLLIGTNIVAIAPLVAKAIDAYRKKKTEEKSTIPPPPETPKEEPKASEPETPRPRDKNDPTNIPPFMREGGI